MQNKIIKIKLSRSLIGVRKNHRDIVCGLGLKRINSVSELIDKISYLIKIQ